MKVRTAKKSDIPKLLPLADELMPREASVSARSKSLRAALREKDYDIYVAAIGSNIIGFVDLWTFPDFVHGARMSIISNLVVSRKAQGKGIGGRLIGAAVARARKKKAKEIYVWTESRNQRAIRFYEKHRFRRRSLAYGAPSSLSRQDLVCRWATESALPNDAW